MEQAERSLTSANTGKTSYATTVLQLHGFYAAKLAVNQGIKEVYSRDRSVEDRRDGLIARRSGGRRGRC